VANATANGYAVKNTGARAHVYFHAIHATTTQTTVCGMAKKCHVSVAYSYLSAKYHDISIVDT
jgi:hypothetical protein